jgi:hypothetical protein
MIFQRLHSSLIGIASIYATSRCSGLFEQVMRHAPSVTPLISKQLCTRHVEDLPSVIPHGGVLFTIRLGEVWPNFLLACSHLRQPILYR